MAAYSILKHHNLNYHVDYYRTISKIISGILTMVYGAVYHSYASKRTIKIISGIITIIYSSINHSYDSNRTNKIISGIITVILINHHFTGGPCRLSTLAPTNKTQSIMTTWIIINWSECGSLPKNRDSSEWCSLYIILSMLL